VVAERRVAVIGGGVSGLASAYHLAAAPSRVNTAAQQVPQVTVLEAEQRLGGKVRTEWVADLPVDTGPDALLIRASAVSGLLRELGLNGSQRVPSTAGAFVWVRGRVALSGLVTPLGLARAAADLVLPRHDWIGRDPTIEELLRPRFGRQIYENMIEPMLGGVHAGRASRLSARSAVPEVMALIQGHRSVYRALAARPPRSNGPALISLDGGLDCLIEALRSAIERAPGARVLTGAGVRSVRRTAGGYAVLTDQMPPLEVDDVVIATPAWEAARLLDSLAPVAAAQAAAIPYAGVATVTVAYPPSAMGRPLDGTGFLVPPAEHRLLVGCSWLTAKWPHLRSDEVVLLRCMVGRDGDQLWADLDDQALSAAVRAELAAAMGVRGEPLAVHIRRIPRAMPQYTVGHHQRLAAIDAALVGLPGVHVTGAGYRGVGIAGCLTQAEAVAAAVLDRRFEAVTA
jgi:oxygen-dependent protoporphyrinogen oxidase